MQRLLVGVVTLSAYRNIHMKIVTWNINSVRARIEILLRWLQETTPDVVLLQETKCLEEQFPREPIEDLGYNIAVVGQKSYNGVAILSKKPIEDISTRLPGFDRDEARYIEAVVGHVRVASIYVPNGQDIGTEKFFQKLAFFKALKDHASTLLSYGEPCVWGGDYNVAPTNDDVYDPEKFQNRLLVSPEERAGFRSLCHLGFVDAVRQIKNQERFYTWWDYRQGSFEKDHGLRIDHLLLSPEASDLLTSVGVDRFTRAWDKPSDHAPVWCTL
jgi:exodeoxyribonuclease-3